MWRHILALILAPAGVLAVAAAPTSTCIYPPKPSNLFQGIVIRVVDGDTADVRLLNGPRERVRLLGIDTPEVYDSEKLERDARASGRSKEEVQALGRLASEFTKRHLGGKEVGLELDVQTRDQYGRLLAYVWLQGGILFNLHILREGYAQVLTIPPNVKYVELLLACQRDAREQRRGLWGR
jgi:micrococcal nuclease